MSWNKILLWVLIGFALCFLFWIFLKYSVENWDLCRAKYWVTCEEYNKRFPEIIKESVYD